MSKFRQHGATVLIAFLGSLLGAWIVYGLQKRPALHPANWGSAPVTLTAFPEHIVEHPNFVTTAAMVTPCVVHIKTKGSAQGSFKGEIPPGMDMFRDFFNGPDMMPRGPQMGSGSGVILSADGYIVTNNHVIKEADEIEVILNDKRSFNGKVVGQDPSSDLAVVKIEANDLPFVKIGNSDKLQIGEWVLAVGNPFNLNSTVTAGIVSAKARNINILGGGTSLEAFIQTDAAVNPGNSGGALVNVQGELVGINTAIASSTGAYQGYAFAIPANLVTKVVEDLKVHGTVQRGFLGIQIRDVDAALVESEDLEVISGAYVADFMPNSAAEEAGIQKGDVITKVEGQSIKSTPELMEIVGRKRPGEKVSLEINRKGKSQTFEVKLRNADGKAELVKAAPKEEDSDWLGAKLERASRKELESLKLESGIKISKLGSGKLKESGIREGFIITKVDKTEVNSPKALRELVRGKKGGLLIEGLYPNGTKGFYGIEIP
ncbi:MAG: Do family serine endopeptidase [Sphingomonadales bacterium]|nr:Do family serine endopeptidase [Sphingomonadales bacterium]MBM3924030.1 Do family serine endopeptidase [Sphingomonadales bacterium]MBM3931616.1 Do family serine endopeptidase [Sphingomonadales bacterium]